MPDTSCSLVDLHYQCGKDSLSKTKNKTNNNKWGSNKRWPKRYTSISVVKGVKVDIKHQYY